MAKIAVTLSEGLTETGYRVLQAIVPTALASGDTVTICFMSEGHIWVMKKTHAELPKVKEIVENLLKQKVDACVCEPALTMRGIPNSEVINGVKVAGAISMLEKAKAADVNLTF